MAKGAFDVSVFAIDPGGTTGWCALIDCDSRICEQDFPFLRGQCGWLGYGVDPDATGHFASTFSLEEHLADECHQTDFLISKIVRCIEVSHSPLTIVIEDFVPRVFNQSRAFLAPVRLIAMLSAAILARCGVGTNGAPRVVFQMPALAMSTITNDYLVLIDQFTRGQPHSNDAVRHTLTYLRNSAGAVQIRGS